MTDAVVMWIEANLSEQVSKVHVVREHSEPFQCTGLRGRATLVSRFRERLPTCDRSIDAALSG